MKARINQRIVALMLPTWANGASPDYWDRTFENYVKEGYRRNEIIYACVNVTANTAASIALQVHARKDDILLPDHPLQLLLNRPNRMMSQYDFLWWTLAYQMLAGVAYWQKIRNQAGEVIEIWPLRPDYVRPHLDENGGGLLGYRIKINGIELEELPLEDVLVFRLPDPLNFFGQQSPVEIISRTADVDNSLTDLYKMLMQQGAMPMGVLSSKLKLRDGDVEDIRRRWSERYGGYSNWMSPAVLDSDASYQRIGLTMQEMQAESLDGRNETRICMVYGIPPILIGGTFGLSRSTFSNYAEARRQWWEDSLSGKYKKLLDNLQTQLADLYADTPILKWDFSAVAALQEERDGRWTRASAAFTAGIIMRNEARKEMGLPDVGAEGNVFIQSIAVTEVQNNPADDAPTSSDVGEVAEDEQPVRQPKALVVVPDEKAEPVVVMTNDPLRWERMYRELFSKVDALRRN